MSKLFKVIYVGVISSMIAFGVGCKPPAASQEDNSKLEQARAAAESAERKLSELRQERIALEQELQGKQNELSNEQGAGEEK